MKGTTNLLLLHAAASFFELLNLPILSISLWLKLSLDDTKSTSIALGDFSLSVKTFHQLFQKRLHQQKAIRRLWKKVNLPSTCKWKTWPREKTYYPHGFTLLSHLQLFTLLSQNINHHISKLDHTTNLVHFFHLIFLLIHVGCPMMLNKNVCCSLDLDLFDVFQK